MKGDYEIPRGGVRSGPADALFGLRVAADGEPLSVLVVDDDPAWQRALERGLLDIDVEIVSTIGAKEDVEGAIAALGRCIVLTELSLAGSSLAGLSVVEAAQRANAPVAIVAGCTRRKIDQLRAVPFLPKVDLNRASLRALLRYLARGL